MDLEKISIVQKESVPGWGFSKVVILSLGSHLQFMTSTASMEITAWSPHEALYFLFLKLEGV